MERIASERANGEEASHKLWIFIYSSADKDAENREWEREKGWTVWT